MAFPIFKLEMKTKKFFMNPIYHLNYTSIIKNGSANNYPFECEFFDVPSDKYVEFLNSPKINKEVYKSLIPFEIARNIACSNSIILLKYDFLRKIVSCDHPGGVLFAVLFDFYTRCGLERDSALVLAIKDQLKCIDQSLLTLTKNYFGAAFKKDEVGSLCLVAFERTFKGNIKPKLTEEYYKSLFLDGNFSANLQKQFSSILVNSVTESTGHKIGSLIGSTVGCIVPIVGSKIGDSVGGAIGSYGGSKLSNILSDSLVNTEEDKIKLIVQNIIVRVSYMFAFCREEMFLLLDQFSIFLEQNYNKLIKTFTKEYYSKLESELFQRAAKITKTREKIQLPSEESYREVFDMLNNQQ